MFVPVHALLTLCLEFDLIILIIGLAHPHESLYCTGRVCFAVGQIVQFCRERYGICMPDLFVLPPKQKLKTAVDSDIVRRVGMIQELVMDIGHRLL